MNFIDITIHHYLTVSCLLFGFGILGILINRTNVIRILMSIELLLLAANLNMVAFSALLKDLTGQIFSIFILTIAAAEAAIGLAIVLVLYKRRNSVNVSNINQLRG